MSTVIVSGDEATLARFVVVLRLPTSTAWFSSVCVAVMALAPSARVAVPLVVMSTVLPEAVPCPINTPLANSWNSGARDDAVNLEGQGIARRIIQVCQIVRVAAAGIRSRRQLNAAGRGGVDVDGHSLRVIGGSAGIGRFYSHRHVVDARCRVVGRDYCIAVGTINIDAQIGICVIRGHAGLEGHRNTVHIGGGYGKADRRVDGLDRVDGSEERRIDGGVGRRRSP